MALLFSSSFLFLFFDAAITDMNGGNREAERSERSDPHETREVSVEGVGGNSAG